MGSKIKSEHLYWLGRYTERVLISVRLLMDMYDQMIDGDPIDYQGFCTRMGIDNIYTDAADFCRRYLFDADDPDSIYCAMRFAYDNAIVLREVLTSEEVRSIFGLSKRSLQNYRDNRQIPFTSIGGKILYPQSSLYKLLEQHYMKTQR